MSEPSSIEFCSIINESGEEYCVYISVPLINLISFRKAITTGSILLEEYGEILFYHKGNVSNQVIKKYLKREFNINHHYEEELISGVEVL